MCSTLNLLIVVLVFCQALCDDETPTFKYVTSYNREGRVMKKEDIEKTSVNVLKPIVFIINGLTDIDKKGDAWSNKLQNAYTEKFVHNIFVVDWNLTSPLESGSTNKAHSVGLAVGDFIDALFNKTGEAYLEIHLVGVALGGEVAASACRRIAGLRRRSVNRITALDPTYYLINNDGNPTILSAENADFVDVVHTNLNKAGELKQTGLVDFYVDGFGDNCEAKDAESQCNTLISIELFAKSINSSDIKATKCNNLENFRRGSCENEEQVIFGENVDKSVRGKYFLRQ